MEPGRAPEDAFEQRFGRAAEIVVRAPGRVNLIGEHSDYHEGLVLPMAINRAVLLDVSGRSDSGVRLYSQLTDVQVELDVHSAHRHPDSLGQYFQGAVAALSRTRPVSRGCDVLIAGDLPAGAGLSSSSALVVGFIAALASVDGDRLDSLQLAKLGCEAEHWFGTSGGIMDQYVIAHGRAGHAVLIDCRSLTHDYVPLPAGVVVVIADTGERHHQAATPFGQRRQEAEAGLRVLQSVNTGVATLRDVSAAELEKGRRELLIADPTGTWWRRCRHVVTEQARVKGLVTALTTNDLAAVGALMAAGHASLRDDYEVSSPALDAMVEAAVSIPGCHGARMTGGGFGGCTVNLVAADRVEAFRTQLVKEYSAASGRESVVFATGATDGLSVAELK